MVWPSGGRRPYSPQWEATKRFVRARSEGRCEVIEQGSRCGQPGHEVDHIVPKSQGGGDGLDNGRMICPSHHSVKTQDEARAGRARIKGFGIRPPEVHPFDRM